MAKDTVVATLTTGEDGTAVSEPQYLGRYRLEERQAPEGMVLDPTPIYTELTYAGQEVEITQAAIGLYDERQKVEIDLLKSLETDETFGIGLGEEYKDISFGLYASEDLTALDGSVIPAGGFWKSWRLRRWRTRPASIRLPLPPTCLLAASMSRNAPPMRHLCFPISSTR